MAQARPATDLVNKALHALEREAGLRLQSVQPKAGQSITLTIAGVHLDSPLQVATKKWAPQANLGVLIHQVMQLPSPRILIADYVNPRMADQLKAEQIQFIDTLGNAYINTPPIYIFIKAHSQSLQTSTRRVSNRAFEATGLKVVFALLCNPQLVSAPYRQIADTAGVSLGSVGWAITGLETAGFIKQGTKQRRHLVNRRKLLDRWVEAYLEKLQPKLIAGEFTPKNPHWWKTFNLASYGAFWGGEIAAAKYLDAIEPRSGIVYLPENAGITLLTATKSRRTSEQSREMAGKIEIVRPFWPMNDSAQRNSVSAKDLVHPILVYADLIGSGNSANREIAETIYQEQIAQKLEVG